MQELELVKNIFRTRSKDNVISVPDQVFHNPNFEYLITIGGSLVENAEEYNRLTHLLKEIGETKFFVLQNLRETIPSNDVPYFHDFDVEDTFKYFEDVVEQFDPPFGFFINDFYVFGHSEKWGIYICEFPTINIVGCTPDLRDKFANVFNIHGNGFQDLKEFICREYHDRDDLKKRLIENYKLA